MRDITLCFVRHGVTANNLTGCFAGRLDPPLTGEGRRELADLVAQHPYPPVQALYCSPARRCLETAAIVYPGAAPEVLPDLQELFFGRAEGASARDLDTYPGADAIRRQELDASFPGGETYGELLGRARSAMDYIVARAGENGHTAVGVVTHSMLLSLLLRHSLHPAAGAGQLYCPNGMGVSVRTTPDVWRQKRQLCFGTLLPEGAVRPDVKSSPYASMRPSAADGVHRAQSGPERG